jgi:hypothetical protein
MNELRNSLIVIGLTLRAFSTAESDCFAPPAEFAHRTLPTRSPLNAAADDVTLNVALTLAPGATGSQSSRTFLSVPGTTAVHPLGTDMLKFDAVAGATVVFVNVTVVSCEDPGRTSGARRLAP